MQYEFTLNNSVTILSRIKLIYLVKKQTKVQWNLLKNDKKLALCICCFYSVEENCLPCFMSNKTKNNA